MHKYVFVHTFLSYVFCYPVDSSCILKDSVNKKKKHDIATFLQTFVVKGIVHPKMSVYVFCVCFFCLSTPWVPLTAIIWLTDCNGLI